MTEPLKEKLKRKKLELEKATKGCTTYIDGHPCMTCVAKAVMISELRSRQEEHICCEVCSFVGFDINSENNCARFNELTAEIAQLKEEV